MSAHAVHAEVRDHPLIRRLAMLGLPRDDHLVFGSGPLLAHGLRRNISDLDVVARGGAWERVCELGVSGVGDITGAPVMSFWGGRIQFSQVWIDGAPGVDELISRSDIIAGVRFASLADVLAYKRELHREKDLFDIDVLTSLRGEEGLYGEYASNW